MRKMAQRFHLKESSAMTAAIDIRAIAHQIKTAQDQDLPFPQITAQNPGFDVAAAYAVAGRIHAMRLAEGKLAVGRKIGFTNPAMWAQYGVSAPIWAYVYDTTVVNLSDTANNVATCCLHNFVNPKIEPEIIFHFHTAPPPNGDMAAVLACIDWVAHGFEIVQSPYPDWKFQAADAIAVGALHARLLVGRRQAVQTLGLDLPKALAAFTLTLSCVELQNNGHLQEAGQGANVLGNPLAAVKHLMQVLANQLPHQPIQADELVTTGTITSAYSVQPGQSWQTALEGISLPGLSVTFVK